MSFEKSYLHTQVKDRLTKTIGVVVFHEQLNGSGRIKVKMDPLPGTTISEEILVSERGFKERFELI